ncbi:hypothetical protein RM531_09940 [Salinisphaera sp. P385]|uniref:Alginate export domain-containing protein n=1 Tax=Spectribacter acetivorans TaxID=3075603 RepID=A0ABU3BC05_9GAMM|nr:hypothetical protein [Salinisphaera sp. P385]MDT0618793.1 hypothetical protein [Salinisphaera sp. P385]
MRRYFATAGTLLALVAAGALPAVAQEGSKPECRRPDGQKEPQRRVPGKSPEAEPQQPGERDPCLPAPGEDDYTTAVAVPDRWRIVDSLGYEQNWWDPYNRNTLKADAPIHDDWFFNITVISDTVYEDREVPTPVGVQSSRSAGDLDLLGGTSQQQLLQNLAVELVYYKGNTVFKPPDYEFRFTPVFNYNYTRLDEILNTNVDPANGTTRNDGFAGLQTAFIDVHLRNVSTRYDFDSIRVGIQPFNADFRGFLFQDQPFGVRLFGTRDNNIFQYNLAWFRRMEKDTNSGLNDPTTSLREDDVFVANLYWQDAIKLGHFLQFTALYNRNREDDFFFDKNGFIQRPASIGFEVPRGYDVGYFGFNTDGHIGRLNLTTSLYYAFGEQDRAPFTGKKSDINAWFGAAELSFDQDWVRWRASLLYGSGDDDPFDDEETGFDAVLENPLFAGADTSYWIRQAVPLIGGGRVTLSQRNGVLNNLRSSREHGQSNFTNPGILLFGLGADFDLLPELRLSLNANHLRFDHAEVLEVARQQANIDEDIGLDLSASVIYRPLMSQNIVLRLSYAELQPGDGYEELFDGGNQRYLLFNATLTY